MTSLTPSKTNEKTDVLECLSLGQTSWCALWQTSNDSVRDCDVAEPAVVDDEQYYRESLGTQPPGTESLMSAFVCLLRIIIVLESVVDVHLLTILEMHRHSYYGRLPCFLKVNGTRPTRRGSVT